MTTRAADHSAVLRDALKEIRQLRERLARAETVRREPIAIVGMGCRFPGGANDPDAYWRLLRDGVDAVTEVPAGRWNISTFYDVDADAPGKMYTRRGGFLDIDVAAFSPEFFNITPREAAMMDPQQRMLLEVCWEALENAGHSAQSLFGSATGVFMGLSTHDYSLLAARPDLSHIDTYSGTGNSASIATGRLSYVLGIQGPSLALDTACSSSLVAVHLACRSLAARECDLALAGGVNLMLSPEPTIYFCKLHALSPDGKCKTFDASADGYVRGEGCGVVVLKRLSDAVASRDTVFAVIRGSAVNQDGRSNGLTAPNEAAQARLLCDALADAGVAPGEVGYVEAHGTGTSLGDPIEVGALAAALGKGRTQPLLLGSVKTNIGHLEAAAGIAGLIKTVLALKHREIPPHLHLNTVNPFVRLADIPARVPIESVPWASTGRRVAGVSSFGFSGTNAHIVLEEAPSPTVIDGAADRPRHMFTASARSANALRTLAGRYAAHIEDQPQLSVGDVCFTANAGRSHFNHRLALPVASLALLRERLAAFAGGGDPDDVLRGDLEEGGTAPEVAFLFTGQGSQYAGMGRQLYETEPRFRRELERCEELLRPYLDVPLLSVMYGEKTELLDETAYTQPALFALEWSLCELWRSWGVEPRGVLGHSVGEYVAACVARVFPVEDGLRLIAARGRLMQGLAPNGTMAAVRCSEDVAREAVRPQARQVSIAAVNGPEDVVLSGDADAVKRVCRELEAHGVPVRLLNVSHAFHSPLMDPILDAFEGVAKDVKYASPQLDLISNVTGQRSREVCDAAYWRNHVRSAVRFHDGLQTLRAEGYTVFLEVGPTPVLTGLGRQAGSPSETWAWSLRRGGDDWAPMLESLGRLYVKGAPMSWTGFDAGRDRRRVPLPTYPFERRRHWLDGDTRPTAELREAPPLTPLLGHRLPSNGSPDVHYEAQISCDAAPFLSDHRVRGIAIFPTAGYVEMAIAAAAAALGAGPYVLEDMLILRALVVPETAGERIRLTLSPSGDSNRAAFTIGPVSTTETATADLYAAGRVAASRDVGSPSKVSPDEMRAGLPQEMSRDEFYEALAANGLEYGEAFRGVERVWLGPGRAVGRIQLPAALGAESVLFQLHPVVLDSCFQLLGAAAVASGTVAGTYVPVGLQRLTVYGRPGAEVWGEAVLKGGGDPAENGGAEALAGDLRLFDAAGETQAVIEGLSLRRASATQLRRLRPQLAERDHRIRPGANAHPILGTPLGPIAALPNSFHWEHEIGRDRLPYAGVYRESGSTVLGVAAFAEMAFAAAEQAQPEASWTIASLEMHEPLVLAESQPRALQVSLSVADDSAALRVYTRGVDGGEAGDPWTLHATARLRSDGTAAESGIMSMATSVR